MIRMVTSSSGRRERVIQLASMAWGQGLKAVGAACGRPLKAEG
jgi:hypothetical protein